MNLTINNQNITKFNISTDFEIKFKNNTIIYPEIIGEIELQRIPENLINEVNTGILSFDNGYTLQFSFLGADVQYFNNKEVLQINQLDPELNLFRGLNGLKSIQNAEINPKSIILNDLNGQYLQENIVNGYLVKDLINHLSTLLEVPITVHQFYLIDHLALINPIQLTDNAQIQYCLMDVLDSIAQLMNIQFYIEYSEIDGIVIQPIGSDNSNPTAISLDEVVLMSDSQLSINKNNGILFNQNYTNFKTIIGKCNAHYSTPKELYIDFITQNNIIQEIKNGNPLIPLSNLILLQTELVSNQLQSIQDSQHQLNPIFSPQSIFDRYTTQLLSGNFYLDGQTEPQQIENINQEHQFNRMDVLTQTPYNLKYQYNYLNKNIQINEQVYYPTDARSAITFQFV
jgi:hypothetical protein